MTRNSTFIFIYTNWMLIIEDLSPWQVSRCLIFTRSREFLQDLAIFEQLARAHYPEGPSDLVHFVVKSVVEKVGSERIFMLVNFSNSDID